MEVKEGVYSVMGNHDYGPYYRWKNKREEIENIQDVQRRETRMGWKLLNNESQILYCKGDSIAL